MLGKTLSRQFCNPIAPKIESKIIKVSQERTCIQTYSCLCPSKVHIISMLVTKI